MLSSTNYEQYKRDCALRYIRPVCGEGLRKIIGAWDAYPSGLPSLCLFTERHIDTVMMEQICEEIGKNNVAIGHTAPPA